MGQKRAASTYARIYGRMLRWAPETMQILRGGLLVTMLLQIGALLLWNAASPPSFDTYETARSAIAMRDLTGVTLCTTLVGSTLVERAARRARNGSGR